MLAEREDVYWVFIPGVLPRIIPAELAGGGGFCSLSLYVSRMCLYMCRNVVILAKQEHFQIQVGI